MVAKKRLVFVACIIVLNIGYVLRWNSDVLRYSLYLSSLLLIGIVLASEYGSVFRFTGNTIVSGRLLRLLVGYMVMIIYSFVAMILNNRFQTRFFQEAFFLMLPLATSIALLRTSAKNSDRFFADMFFTVTAILMVQSFFKGSFSISSIQNSVDAVLRSSVGFESIFSLVFGIFAIYYLAVDRKFSSTIAIALTIIGFKRIAIIAVVFALLTFFTLWLLNVDFSRKTPRFFIALIAVIFNLAIIGILVAASQGIFDNLFSNFTSASMQEVTQGRTRVVAYFVRSLGFSWFSFGVGLGTLPSMLSETFYGGNTVTVNSDVFKLFYEFGVVVFVLFFGLVYYYGAQSRGLLTMLVYANIVLATDNILIYSEFMIPLYFLLGSLFVQQVWCNSDLNHELRQIRPGLSHLNKRQVLART